jgi:hypothetical protein
MKYVIKVIWPKVDVYYYLNAAGRLGPLGDAFHYSKLSIAQIMVNLNTGRYADTTLEIVEIKLQLAG